MAIALAPTQPERLSLPRIAWSEGEAELEETQRSSQLVRLATACAIAIGVAYPLFVVGVVAFFGPPVGGADKVLPAVAATLCFLPLLARHVLHAVRGTRPYGLGWTLAGTAVVIFAAVPVVGIGWLLALHALAMSVLAAR